jgi:hypothetical protein
MLEPFILLMLVALVPATVFVCVVILYQQSTPTGDEVDVQPAIYVVASAIGVLLYLGGVALGRRLRRSSSDGASVR